MNCFIKNKKKKNKYGFGKSLAEINNLPIIILDKN